MVKEGITLVKFLSLCKLEANHEVDIGHAYRTTLSVKLFTHYIVQAQCEQFFQSLAEKKFYSFLMDESTDEGNVHRAGAIRSFVQER